MVATVPVRSGAPRIAAVPPSPHLQMVANNAAARALQVFSAASSDGNTTTTDDEGDQLTSEELAKCALHVQQLLQRINSLQQGLDTGHVLKHHRRRRMHKSYLRIHRKLEATFLGSTDVAPREFNLLSRARRGLQGKPGRSDQQLPRQTRLPGRDHFLPSSAASKDPAPPTSRGLENRGSANTRSDVVSEPQSEFSKGIASSPARRLRRRPSISRSTRPGLAHEYEPPRSRSEYQQVRQIPRYRPQSSAYSPATVAYYQIQQMRPARNQRSPPLQTSDTLYFSHSNPARAPNLQVERRDRNISAARNRGSDQVRVPVQRRRSWLNHQTLPAFGSDSVSESMTESDEEYELLRRRRAHRNRLHISTASAVGAPESRRPQTMDATVIRPASSRRASFSRSPLVPSVESHSAYDTSRARVSLEGSRSSRHHSSPANDQPAEASRHETRREIRPEEIRAERARNFHDIKKEYRSKDEDSEPLERHLRRIRAREKELHSRRHRAVEDRQIAGAEDCIDARRGSEGRPAPQSYGTAYRRPSRLARATDQSESSTEDHDRQNKGEIRLRIDASQSLRLSSEMEGRSLEMQPAEDGMCDIIIAENKRSRSTHSSERGNHSGGRLTIIGASPSRRAAEETLEKMQHASRRRRQIPPERREARRVPLRRRRRHGDTCSDTESELDAPAIDPLSSDITSVQPDMETRRFLNVSLEQLAASGPAPEGVQLSDRDDAPLLLQESGDSSHGSDSLISRSFHNPGRSESIESLSAGSPIASGKENVFEIAKLSQEDVANKKQRDNEGNAEFLSFVGSLFGKNLVEQLDELPSTTNEDQGEDIVDHLLQQWTVNVAASDSAN